MGVGMLLYMVNYYCPKFSNSVREFSKVADGATSEGHFNALLRTIKYVLGTEDHNILLQPKFYNDSFYLEGVSDSDDTGVLDRTRISLCTTAWKSKVGKSVNL
jgi:hypothetical protein